MPAVAAPDLRSLRERLYAARAEHGRGSSEAAALYHELTVTAFRAGTPLDGLRRYAESESERFFARTIQGPDGHVYWDGFALFTMNDSRRTHPRRWWWRHAKGPLDQYTTIVASCGEKNCINPEHQEREDRGERRRLMSDREMLGALQVVALRLGHAPSTDEWRAMKVRPSTKIYIKRFGSWPQSLTAAGLASPARSGRTTSAEGVLKAIAVARRHLGHWPNEPEFTERVDIRELLHAAGLPSSRSGFRRHFGRWGPALAAAKKAYPDLP